MDNTIQYRFTYIIIHNSKINNTIHKLTHIKEALSIPRFQPKDNRANFMFRKNRQLFYQANQ